MLNLLQGKTMAKAHGNSDTAHPDDEITEEKLLGYFTTAYVLDVAGLLDEGKKEKLDSLVYPNAARWDESVEECFGINRRFVKSVYNHCCEVNTPPAAVTFILRGLGCPDYEERLQELRG